MAGIFSLVQLAILVRHDGVLAQTVDEMVSDAEKGDLGGVQRALESGVDASATNKVRTEDLSPVATAGRAAHLTWWLVAGRILCATHGCAEGAHLCCGDTYRVRGRCEYPV